MLRERVPCVVGKGLNKKACSGGIGYDSKTTTVTDPQSWVICAVLCGCHVLLENLS
jgi:hypothetical protein